jgi:hypothetical protein
MAVVPLEKKLRWGRLLIALVVLVALCAGVAMLVAQ